MSRHSERKQLRRKSRQRIGSRTMGRYYDPAKNGRFKDSRGRNYEVQGGTVYRVAEV